MGMHSIMASSRLKRLLLRHTHHCRCDVWQRYLFVTPYRKCASDSGDSNSRLAPGPSKKHKSNQTRYNSINIQMLYESLHKQIFGMTPVNNISMEDAESVKKHLGDHKLWGKSSGTLAEVDFSLPKLSGSNIDEHFKMLATKQTKPYFEQAELVANMSLPPRPRKWIFRKGWTKYDPETGTCVEVVCPDDKALVFDVEVLMSEGQFPTLAVAASPKAWYSWCSDRLVEDCFKWKDQRPLTSDLIPLETARGSTKPVSGSWQPKLVIGHNVSFDRTFVKEQYYIKGPKTRFLDTMSMHIATSGQTGFQRMLYIARKKNSRRKEVREMGEHHWWRGPPTFEWAEESTLNNLNDVYQLHCKGAPLDKETRQVFVKGDMKDVREDFQNLMIYCANDVKATLAVFQALWPTFLNRFPHPVTVAGMLEMGTAFLPVNANWDRYISESDAIHNDLQREGQLSLTQLANDACSLLEDKRYKDDVWLWDVDWSTRENTYNGPRLKKTKKTKTATEVKETEGTREDRVASVFEIAKAMPKRQPYMAGYPKWYTDLCPKLHEVDEKQPLGPSKISTLKRITPKLLRLTWDGFPLHYNDTHGWGYLVPGREDDLVSLELDRQEEEEAGHDGKEDGENDLPTFPTKALYLLCKPVFSRLPADEHRKSDEILNKLYEKLETLTDDGMKAKYWSAILGEERKLKRQFQNESCDGPSFHKGIGPRHDVMLPGAWFFQLPHKDGPTNRVGNPLAKDFISKIEDGVLASSGGIQAEQVLRLRSMCSYWNNNRSRISSQMVVRLHKGELPRAVTKNRPNPSAFIHLSYDEDAMYGAILPRVVTAGTVTRRAVEPTWMTASNAYPDRIGSELKAMVQCPPGYHLVGADVDSQELWIAAILGDSEFANVHGCTAFGWMTLQGSKVEGTDLHSKTADLVGISRDQAKIFNYGRIYGAGKLFAERLLMQFNHRLTKDDAKRKAEAMYQATKGKRVRRRRKMADLDEESDNVTVTFGQWQGGSESYMFNKLEKIARSEEPRTPVLGCMISKALEPRNVNTDFMTSRINWVVQSSAVDYLHLMLVCMRWLFEEFNIDGRFCISIHDEVHYLVRSEDRYRAALALQIANLLTRSMFSYKLGMNDLPQSVAFFSCVDIDTCLRKEVTLDCKTPSNPLGLHRGYGIPPGEALNIYEILEKTNKSLKASKQRNSSQKDTEPDEDALLDDDILAAKG